MKGKDTKTNRGVRETKTNTKTIKGKSTAKQGKALKKGVKKKENASKKEDKNCSNNATDDTLQCREDEVYGGGGRLWSIDASSLTLRERQMLADPQR